MFPAPLSALRAQPRGRDRECRNLDGTIALPPADAQATL
jgi:hypothetical protein